MNCPKCDDKTTVKDTTVNKADCEVYRKRKCLSCGYRFTTAEFEVDFSGKLKEAWYTSHRSAVVRNSFAEKERGRRQV